MLYLYTEAFWGPDFNPLEGSYHQAKYLIRENDIALRCCTQLRSVRKFILHAFGQISPENHEGTIEIVATSNEEKKNELK